MTDYSHFDPFQLATDKLKRFDSLLSDLSKNKKKLQEAIERDKHVYFDNPPYTWNDFRKFISQKILESSNKEYLYHNLQKIAELADQCIVKYASLFRMEQKHVKYVFLEFPHDTDKIDYAKYRFKLDIEFCVKSTDYYNQVLPLIAMNPHEDQSYESQAINVKPIGKAGSNIITKETALEAENDKSITGKLPNKEPEIVFHGQEELADYLGCSLTKIWRLKKILPFYQVGRMYYYKKHEIDNTFRGKEKKYGLKKLI